MGDMGREGGEVVLHRLRVADVGKDLVENRHDGAGLRGDREPGLHHERKQPDRLEGHGLATRVGPGDDHAPVVLGGVDVVGNDAHLAP